jgi:hypothetical protein
VCTRVVDAAQDQGRGDMALVTEEHALEHGAGCHHTGRTPGAEAQEVELRAVCVCVCVCVL